MSGEGQGRGMRGKGLTIATWNIGSSRDFGAIAARVAALNIDICALQEVSLDPAAGLASMFDGGKGGAYGWHFAPARSSDTGPAAGFGLGFLSRVPLRRSASLALGPRPGHATADSEHENRILQIVVPDVRRPILLGNTHLAATDDWSLSAVRRAQARAIADIFRPSAAQAAVILGGDFNIGPSSSDLAELRDVLPFVHCSSGATFIGEPDRPPIDFFLSSQPVAMGVTVHSSQGLSDHDIVVASFAPEP